mgnify:CR=1 FL=1|tara:strand:- start:2845 stop:3051 length:207 start_codon:yes stop_codon:yes gene_type:complete
MINIHMKEKVSCENVCKKIEQEVQKWVQVNGHNLDDCFLNISIVKVAHTLDATDTTPTMTHTETEDQT